MDADWNAVVPVALLFLGAAVMLAAAGGLFTGNWGIVRYAAPAGLVGLGVALLGVRGLERVPGVGG